MINIYASKIQQKRIIDKVKNLLKKEEAYIDLCKKYKKDLNFIDNVPIYFKELEVSAKTVNEEIFLNDKLLKADWHDLMRYVQHEITHVFQQDAGLVEEQVGKENYLKDKNEQEAFQKQIKFMKKHTPEEVQDYLEHLLDHHNIKGKERRHLVEKLTRNT